MLKTTPMKVIIAELIVVTIVLVSSAIETSSLTAAYACARWSAAMISRSSLDAAHHSSTAHASPAVGANQKVSRRCSRSGESARGLRGPLICATCPSLPINRGYVGDGYAGERHSETLVLLSMSPRGTPREDHT